MNNFLRKYTILLVFAVAVVAFFVDGSFTTWIHNQNVLGGIITVPHLLMVAMLGMGMTLNLRAFTDVLKHPKEVFIGCAAQFVVMPLLAFSLIKIFNLPNDLAVGVMLVGTCPGGTSSNVITYMAKGDLALSIEMTALSTLLAPILTPLLTLFYLHTSVEVNVMDMFVSILKIIFLPISLGFAFNYFCKKIAQRIVKFMPLVSIIAISLITGYVTDANDQKLMSCGLLIITVVMLHNLFGYATGFFIGTLFKMPQPKRNTLSIEVGMQNSGLATSLATTSFPALALATVPGAIFTVWHNISGITIANIMTKYQKKKSK